MTKPPQPVTSDEQLHAYLEKTGRVAIIWDVEDIKILRPNLSEHECMEVLRQCIRYHDCEVGINWDVLKFHTEDLFPVPDDAQ